MKCVCDPGKVWQVRYRLRRQKQAEFVCYPYPGRPSILYARRYVLPRNPGTPPQADMRQLFGALSRDWLGLLTPPQQDAWTAFARNCRYRWGPAWIDYARQLNCCWPHALTAYHRRIIRRWLLGARPLSGPQAYLKVNSVLGRIGRPKRLWPPPPPVPFRPNPVQAVRIRWNAARFRLELVVKHHVKGDLLLFASAPCSAGWSKMRRPVYLVLLPAPKEGVYDITALYLARFPAPEPGERVFIRVCQHRHGWESAPQDHSALVPPQPAPLRPPVSNGHFPILNSQFSIGPSRFAPWLPLRLSPGHLPPRRVAAHPSCTSAILLPGTHPPPTPCTRGTRFPRPSATAGLSRRSGWACHRRKFRCRHLWRGS